ncbi:MAG: DUF58 domain-containing protein [Gammaproteobacteria bacterium]|nr:DUF58 domain-containing protein [Gammaproteobacteria bacterium]
MRALIRRLRAGFDERMRAWLMRRQGIDRDPVRLERRRIYILPTRLGLAYAAMVFAMVIGGLNYNNNLGLGLAFLLVSLGLVTMHHCHGTLSGLSLRLLATDPAFAGQDVRFEVLLENGSSAMRPRIEVSRNDEAPRTIDVPALGSAPAEVDVHAARRGRIPLDRFVVATRHPLGLFRAWAVVHPEYSAVAWPRPAERRIPPPGVETDTGGAQDRAQGEEDFAGLKPYQAGDSLRRIAWKAYARGQGLHTKQYAGTDVVSHVFDWDSLPGLDTESRLSQLCRWVLDAHEHGEAFGLRLPGLAIEANIGTAHRERCLTALALFQHEDARG